MTQYRSFVEVWRDTCTAPGVFSSDEPLLSFESSSCDVVDGVQLWHGWGFQVAFDLSVLMVAAKLLDLKATGELPSAALRCHVRQLVGNKCNISV